MLGRSFCAKRRDVEMYLYESYKRMQGMTTQLTEKWKEPVSPAFVMRLRCAYRPFMN